jgi:hypothetical protein
MSEILKAVRSKLNGAAFVLISTSVALVLLAAAVVWEPILAQIIVGLLILLVAFVFAYLGSRFLAIKKEIEKIFKL